MADNANTIDPTNLPADYKFEAKDFNKIADYIRSSNQGGFITSLGETLRKSDLENARKLGVAFRSEFLAYLEEYNRRNPGA